MKRRRLAAWLVPASLIVAGPVCADESALIDSAKAAVARSLKDPESARFADLRIGRTANGEPVVCGTVNAKNSYGGYTGAAPFFYTQDGEFRIVEGRSPMLPLFKTFCGSK